MKIAVGTSLLIILKSLIGVIGDLQYGVSLNTNLLFPWFFPMNIIGPFKQKLNAKN